MDVVLTQRWFHEDGIVGVLNFPLFRGDQPQIYTLELPWLDNERCISCIPHGEYDLTPEEPTPKFDYPHLSLWDVPTRTAIRIHVGNYPKDTTGCVLVGLAKKKEDAVILDSRKAMETLMDLVGKFIARTGKTTLTLTHIEAPEK